MGQHGHKQKRGDVCRAIVEIILCVEEMSLCYSVSAFVVSENISKTRF